MLTLKGLYHEIERGIMSWEEQIANFLIFPEKNYSLLILTKLQNRSVGMVKKTISRYYLFKAHDEEGISVVTDGS